MSDGAQKIDPALRRMLARLGGDETVDVLVYPIGRSAAIVNYLTARKAAGELEFNVLELAGCIAVRCTAAVVDETAARPDVARVTVNPTFHTNTDS